MNALYVRAFRSSFIGTLVMAALVFVPAWTLDYWQAWAFIATFVLSTAIITIYLAKHDPQLLERRMRGGSQAEKEKSRKLIIVLGMLFLSHCSFFPRLITGSAGRL